MTQYQVKPESQDLDEIVSTLTDALNTGAGLEVLAGWLERVYGENLRITRKAGDPWLLVFRPWASARTAATRPTRRCATRTVPTGRPAAGGSGCARCLQRPLCCPKSRRPCGATSAATSPVVAKAAVGSEVTVDDVWVCRTHESS